MDHATRARQNCIRELQQLIDLAHDYDFDELTVTALQEGIRALQAELGAE